MTGLRVSAEQFAALPLEIRLALVQEVLDRAVAELNASRLRSQTVQDRVIPALRSAALAIEQSTRLIAELRAEQACNRRGGDR